MNGYKTIRFSKTYHENGPRFVFNEILAFA